MTLSRQLPEGFEALEPFVDAWAAAPAAERYRRRLASTEASRVAFFEAARPLLAAALERLDAKPLAEFDPAETCLMNLMLAFAHVSIAVEIQGDEEPKHAAGARFLHITRATADLPA